MAGQFEIPISLFGGANVVTASSIFRYTSTPMEEHIGMQLYNLTVQIEAIEGIDTLFTLNAGGASLPAETSFDSIVFSGTEPFTLNGTDESQATLRLNAV